MPRPTAHIHKLSLYCSFFFFFNHTATTEIYTLSLHDALPICPPLPPAGPSPRRRSPTTMPMTDRSEEPTSELQSRGHIVCRLLLEKKQKLCYQPLPWQNRTDPEAASPLPRHL